MLPHQKRVRKPRPIIVLAGRHQALLGATGVPGPPSATVILRSTPWGTPTVQVVVVALVVIALWIAHPVSQHIVVAQQSAGPTDPVLIVAVRSCTRIVFASAGFFIYYFWRIALIAQTSPLIVPAVCSRASLIAVPIVQHPSAAAWRTLEVAGIVPQIFAGSHVAVWGTNS